MCDGVTVKAVAYAVAEVDSVQGYQKPVVSGGAIQGFVITNKYEPATKSVRFIKKWDDADDQDGMRPAYVVVQLKADGVAYGDPLRLSTGNRWTETFTDLPKNAEGSIAKPIEYSVEEVTKVADYADPCTAEARRKASPSPMPTRPKSRRSKA